MNIAGNLLEIIGATTAACEITSTSYGNIWISCFNLWSTKKWSLMAGEDIRNSILKWFGVYFTFLIFSAYVVAVSVGIFFRCERLLIIDIRSFFFKFFIWKNKKTCILLFPYRCHSTLRFSIEDIATQLC